MTQDATPTERALTAALERLYREGYQPMYNGRPSCPFCGNFVDDEETHTAGCVLRTLDAERAARAEPGLRDWEFNWIKVQVAVESRTNRQGVVDWPSVAAELTLMVRAALSGSTAPLDRERLARALHNTYERLRGFEACDHEPMYGEGRTECRHDADAIAAEYARLAASPDPAQGGGEGT